LLFFKNSKSLILVFISAGLSSLNMLFIYLRHLESCVNCNLIMPHISSAISKVKWFLELIYINWNDLLFSWSRPLLITLFNIETKYFVQGHISNSVWFSFLFLLIPKSQFLLDPLLHLVLHWPMVCFNTFNVFLSLI